MSGLRRRVLIVEDEVVIRAHLAAVLEDEGFIVTEAGDVLQGYECLEEAKDLSLVITDVRLPGELNGASFAQVVSEHSPHLPIIVISGGGKPQAGEMPRSVTFLEKPIFADELIDAVRAVLVRSI
jgi:DNA-binding NtrC family response regulator